MSARASTAVVCAYEEDLNTLLCAVCHSEFTLTELRVHMIEPDNQHMKLVKVMDATGVLQERTMQAHRHVVVHGQRPCLYQYTHRVSKQFYGVLQEPAARRSKCADRTGCDRHALLYASYRHYHHLAAVRMRVMPTLQVTHSDAPSAVIEARVDANHSFGVLDREEWTANMLASFLQRFAEFTLQITLPANVQDGLAVATMFQQELLKPGAIKAVPLPLHHRLHVWAETTELAERKVALRFILWQGLADDAARHLFRFFLSERSVGWIDLALASSASGAAASEFAVLTRKLHAQLESDVNTAVAGLVACREWPEKLKLYRPEVVRSRVEVAHFSEVTITPARTAVAEDLYHIRLNTQETPATGRYFMIHWVQPTLPQLLQVRGQTPEPGIPLEVCDHEAVVADLHEDRNLRFVDASDNKLVRVL
jgi:hypothetical protein